ncbi:hypothetical protein [Plesiomonas shigelloides]|uniref:hypothetical protein n=1 Tax=Plesiomonas shigelloides TaxID=703 RepID=UPI000A1106A9|nr:hypothetical protein [Plesiomonas shigelloides]
MTLPSLKINYLINFFVVFVFVLNPYTVIGPLSYFLFPLLIYPLLDKCRLLSYGSFFLLLTLVFISLVGVFSSFLHNIGQFVHLKVAISIVFYFAFAYAIFLLFNRNGLSFNDLVFLILLAVVLNSAVVVMQVVYPGFRSLIEGFLAPSGNIDWTEGFRYRGFASGGGASLSVLIPVAIVLALHLYSEKIIGVFVLFLFVPILLVSLFFIGRTGFLLLPIVFASFVFFNLQKYIFKVFLFFLIMIVFFLFFGETIKNFVIEQYGVGFYNYSFGFFLGGVDGIKDEGTVGIIVEFLQVVPYTFPEVLIGYGFYGGSHFEPWTDSGYSRMFLSVGYFFGVAFYLSFFLIFRSVILSRKFLFLTIGIVLLVAEFKEPLLFTGYASRVYVFLLGYALFEYAFLKRMRNINTKNNATDRIERFA